jgi:hypothetical protein
MSLPPHREKDAKVEGRDPPETVKDTMELFRALTTRLLRVPINEVEEQQAIYDKANSPETIAITGKKKRPRLKSPPAGDSTADNSDPTRR